MTEEEILSIAHRTADKYWHNGSPDLIGIRYGFTDRVMVEFARRILAAEKESEYDLSHVIPLTHRKAKGIIKDNGYVITGFVLTATRLPIGMGTDKCIVDMSAVRWLGQAEFMQMMHPVVTSPTSEPEAEPLAWDNERADEIVTELYRRFKDWSKRGFTSDDVSWCEVKANINELISLRLKHLHPPNPSPARKPMTEMEVGEEILRNADEWSRNFANGFALGIRYAEKHHHIGVSDERKGENT